MSVRSDWLARRAELSPDREALVCAATGRRLTYRAWNDRAGAMAGFLERRRGVGRGRGDRVAVIAESSLAYLDLVFACQKLGVSLINVNARLAAAEIETILARVRPSLVLCGEELEAAGGEAAGGEAAGGEADGPSIPVARSDPWLVVFTGGSTGTPKGAVLTHGSVLANAIGTAEAWDLDEDDVAILDAPLFHTGGLNVLTTPLVHAGGTSIVCPRFDPDRTFDLLARERVTLLFGVPTMLQRLVEHPRWPHADLSTVRLAVTGGAPAPRWLFDAFLDRGVRLRLGYGLSEAGPNNFVGGSCGVGGPGFVGAPLSHVEATLADGELLLRGPHVMAGYLDDEAATAAAIDAGGWLHTGDLAARDADGRFTIVGRKKELYISGGENVYPVEIEQVLVDHPSVREAAVIGVPHPAWGEAGVAIVVAREPIGESTLRSFLRGRLAGYKVPKTFVFLPELPRTGAGKVDKPALVRLAGRVRS